MTRKEISRHIRKRIKEASQGNLYTVMHLQMIKFYKEFKSLSGRVFCEEVKISLNYKTEFSTMQRIAPKLVKAELDTSLIE